MKTLLLSAWMLCALLVAAAVRAEDRYYVDSPYAMVRYEDLSRPEQPLRLKIHYDDSNVFVTFKRRQIIDVLHQSGLIRSSYVGEDGWLKINFGLGVDSYERSGPGTHGSWMCSVVAELQVGERYKYHRVEQRVYWFSGEAQAPEGLTPASSPFDQWEQLLLRALLDLQREGLLPKAHSPTANVT